MDSRAAQEAPSAPEMRPPSTEVARKSVTTRRAGDRSERASDTPQLDASELDRAWNWLLHEDNLLTNRLNFLLVAESMMMAAFAQLINASEFASWIVLLGGLWFGVIWRRVIRNQIKFTLDPLKENCAQHWRFYASIRRHRQAAGGVNWSLGVFIPTIIILIWVSLGCVQLFSVAMPHLRSLASYLGRTLRQGLGFW